MSHFVLEPKLPELTVAAAADWVRAAVNLSRQVTPPTDMAGRGAVICAGGRYLTSAWIGIKTARHFGAKLPVQLWHLGPEELLPSTAATFKPLDVELVDARALQKIYPHPRLNGWELKAYALLHCPWREVLFLDADNIPLQNVDSVFDFVRYQQFGALFWPDRGRWPADSPIWAMTGIAYQNEEEFEAGQFVVDRQRCWRELTLANMFNENSPFWYSHVHGDKDTFRLAWRALETNYGMIPHYGDGGWPLFHQKDENGNLLFHHGVKWDTQPNTRFQYVPDICNKFLAEYLLRTAATPTRRVSEPKIKTQELLEIDTKLSSNIGIDRCHIEHIYGVARALKPVNVLEIGLGTGATATALLKALAQNNRGQLTAVDNWFDFGGQQPQLAAFDQQRLSVITANEEDFVRNAAPIYDLIVSDADHNNAQRWWEETVQLAKPGGCVFFHDVTYQHTPNLRQIYEESRQKYAVQLFNTSTTADEACDRGLLVVWRGEAPALKQPRTAVLQFATGGAQGFLDCAELVHAHACKRFGYDYIVEREAKLNKNVYWEKQRMLAEAAANGYDFICWLDADSLWLGETDLLTPWAAASPRAVFAATYHGERAGAVNHHYNHVNAGVLFVRNIKSQAAYSLSLWGNIDDEGHPWGDQHALNKLFNIQPELVHVLGHEWNTVEWCTEYSAVNPYIIAWHGKPDMVMSHMPNYVAAYKAKYGI